MKSQGSIEFIILLAAISAFSIVVVAGYSHISSFEANAYNAVANSSQIALEEPASIPIAPYIYLYLPNTTYTNASNIFHVLAYSPGSYSLAFNAAVSEGGGQVVPENYSGTGAGFSDIALNLFPERVGALQLVLSARISYGNAVFSKNVTASSYAINRQTGQNSSQGQQNSLYASIVRHNESLVYGSQDWSDVYDMVQTSRCSYEDFLFHQYSIQIQCGDARWYYFESDSQCYSEGITTRTYCVYLDAGNASYASMNQTPAYIYNITLYLHNSSGATYASNLSSANPSAGLYMKGRSYGDVVVGNDIYAALPTSYAETVLLNSGNVIYQTQQLFLQCVRAGIEQRRGGSWLLQRYRSRQRRLREHAAGDRIIRYQIRSVRRNADATDKRLLTGERQRFIHMPDGRPLRLQQHHCLHKEHELA